MVLAISLGILGFITYMSDQPVGNQKLKEPERLERCVLEGKKLTCWRNEAYVAREGIK